MLEGLLTSEQFCFLEADLDSFWFSGYTKIKYAQFYALNGG